jgi:hypothetical protein
MSLSPADRRQRPVAALARYQRLVDPDHSRGRPHVDPAVFVQPVPRCLEQILALSDLHNADAQTLT